MSYLKAIFVTIFTVFFAVLVANFEIAGFAPKQKYTGWTVSLETVRTAKSWPRKNQSEHRDLPRLGLRLAIQLFLTYTTLAFLQYSNGWDKSRQTDILKKSKTTLSLKNMFRSINDRRQLQVLHDEFEFQLKLQYELTLLQCRLQWVSEVFMLPSLTPHLITVLRDSFTFVREIQNLRLSGNFMVSFDVESLFTNIPLNECIDLEVKYVSEGNPRS